MVPKKLTWQARRLLTWLLLEWDQFKSKGLRAFAACPGFVKSNPHGPGGGKAEDPEVSGQLLLSIIEGERNLTQVVLSRKWYLAMMRSPFLQGSSTILAQL